MPKLRGSVAGLQDAELSSLQYQLRGKPRLRDLMLYYRPVPLAHEASSFNPIVILNYKHSRFRSYCIAFKQAGINIEVLSNAVTQFCHHNRLIRTRS